jgi:putative membrane protein
MRHYQTSEHLANERTHLAYLRTAIALVTLGVIVNRISIYLIEQDRLEIARRSLGILTGATYAGLGMVVYGLLLLGLALRRYREVDRAIERLDYKPDRVMVEVTTLTALVGGLAATLWILVG